MGFNIERADKPFVVKSPYKPSGDQPQAIEELATRIENGENDVVLMGATGTGKTFIAFQLAWKLFHSRWNPGDWKKTGEPTRLSTKSPRRFAAA